MRIPLAFQPRVGTVVLCDFHGFIVPEMVKLREVVVIARNRKNNSLVTIVPLSSTAPNNPEPYHYKLSKNPRPGGDITQEIWAKCDMVYTVSCERLCMHERQSRRGKKHTVPAIISPEELIEIRRCVAIALDLADSASVPARGF